MTKFLKIGGLLFLSVISGPVSAQKALDMKGTWLPSAGDDVIDGNSKHTPDGTAPVAGGGAALHKDITPFVFKFVGQDGYSFWGNHSAGQTVEKLVGALSRDGKRFVMADEDGTFTGTVVNADTLDFCYAHSTPKSIAASCGLLVRQK